MTKRANNPSNETGEAILAENAAHEGQPRAASAERAQESWEEFKERTNKAAESVLEEVTHPEQLRTRVRRTARRAKTIVVSYRSYVIAAAAVVIAGALYAALRPEKKKRWFSF